MHKVRDLLYSYKRKYVFYSKINSLYLVETIIQSSCILFYPMEYHNQKSSTGEEKLPNIYAVFGKNNMHNSSMLRPWWRKWHPIQHSYLGNPMDRGAWWATVRRVTKSQAWLSNSSQDSTLLRIKVKYILLYYK